MASPEIKAGLGLDATQVKSRGYVPSLAPLPSFRSGAQPCPGDFSARLSLTGSHYSTASAGVTLRCL